MRAKTEEEVITEVLEHIRDIADYWSKLPDQTPKEKCNGTAFSILSLLDGCSALPAFGLKLEPHPMDKQYYKDNKKNWYDSEMVISDMLHERYFDNK